MTYKLIAYDRTQSTIDENGKYKGAEGRTVLHGESVAGFIDKILVMGTDDFVFRIQAIWDKGIKEFTIGDFQDKIEFTRKAELFYCAHKKLSKEITDLTI